MVTNLGSTASYLLGLDRRNDGVLGNYLNLDESCASCIVLLEVSLTSLWHQCPAHCLVCHASGVPVREQRAGREAQGVAVLRVEVRPAAKGGAC